jgi:GDP/UDP-N,N'-diacetylbacillosamine 2-epimerase (hydrolysing)
MMRIGVVTFARSEYSSCLPLLRFIKADPDLQLHLMVSGMHLSPDFGYTVKDIESDGFAIDDRIEMLLSSDTPEGLAKSLGLGTIGFAQSFTRYKPDLLVMVGDRTELLSVASTALLYRIPLAHISGGDVTEGAIDNQVRHAISKLSHLHFVAMPAHAERLLQMGEEPWRVHVTGDPALDLLRDIRFLSRGELEDELGLKLTPPLVLVTYHPTTLGTSSASQEIDGLLSALARIEGTLVCTYPNADAEGRDIVAKLNAFVARQPAAALYHNLGQTRYYSLLRQADLMVGNSSSGIWEAPSFRLAVVNVGDRQRGRLRAGNVIDVPPDADAIYDGIRRALEPSFRAALQDLSNPYGDGYASQRIVHVLKATQIGPALLQKKFVDLAGQARRPGGTDPGGKETK